ncbi:MAG: DUF1499 domain-containing protein [Desulfovibrio sp.]|nr:DUF1499 domain-containing protein [Desulfovibrio sp.]MCA1985167.1 DUF1499 domain-containing protein [Desulfovibrio sp.]
MTLAHVRIALCWGVSLTALVVGGLSWLAHLSTGLPPPLWENVPVCGVTPNCVSSKSPATAAPRFYIDPIPFHGGAPEALRTLEALLSSMPGMVIVAAGPSSIQARLRSRVFGFIDDLYFKAEPAPRHGQPGAAEGVIHCYSASRVGYWDFGANRRRIARLAAQFAAVQ